MASQPIAETGVCCQDGPLDAAKVDKRVWEKVIVSAMDNNLSLAIWGVQVARHIEGKRMQFGWQKESSVCLCCSKEEKGRFLCCAVGKRTRRRLVSNSTYPDTYVRYLVVQMQVHVMYPPERRSTQGPLQNSAPLSAPIAHLFGNDCAIEHAMLRTEAFIFLESTRLDSLPLSIVLSSSAGKTSRQSRLHPFFSFHIRQWHSESGYNRWHRAWQLDPAAHLRSPSQRDCAPTRKQPPPPRATWARASRTASPWVYVLPWSPT